MSYREHPQYQRFRESRPTASTGDGATAAYWRGYDGHPNRYVRTSAAWAAWFAGRDNARDDSRARAEHDPTNGYGPACF